MLAANPYFLVFQIQSSHFQIDHYKAGKTLFGENKNGYHMFWCNGQKKGYSGVTYVKFFLSAIYKSSFQWFFCLPLFFVDRKVFSVVRKCVENYEGAYWNFLYTFN